MKASSAILDAFFDTSHDRKTKHYFTTVAGSGAGPDRTCSKHHGGRVRDPHRGQ